MDSLLVRELLEGEFDAAVELLNPHQKVLFLPLKNSGEKWLHNLLSKKVVEMHEERRYQKRVERKIENHQFTLDTIQEEIKELDDKIRETTKHLEWIRNLMRVAKMSLRSAPNIDAVLAQMSELGASETEAEEDLHQYKEHRGLCARKLAMLSI